MNFEGQGLFSEKPTNSTLESLLEPRTLEEIAGNQSVKDAVTSRLASWRESGNFHIC